MAGAGYKLFNTGDVLTAAQVNTYLQEQAVMRFANSTARTTALSGVLAEGMMSYLDDTNSVEVYNGSAWVSVGSTGDITGVTAGTGISGGGTSGDVTITNSMATAIDAKGDLIVGTGADTFSRLAVGATDGHTLQVDSSTATGLKWAAAAAGGGMTLISETSASGLSSLVFSSLGSYKQLLLLWCGIRHSNNSSAFALRFNNDSGTKYITQGFRQRVSTTDIGGTLSATSVQSFASGVAFNAFGSGVDNSNADTDCAGSVLLDNYTSTTKSKKYTYVYGYYDTTAGYYYINSEGYFNDTAAITSLDIVRVTGSGTFTNQNNTTIRLYGIS